jgi:hypothetical protein
VYDDNSLLSGFIDPNAEVFAYYNVDKPVEVVNGIDPSGNVVHRGQSMYTSGNILADGSALIGGRLDVSGGITMSSGAFKQYRPITTLPAGNTALTVSQILGGINSQATNANPLVINLPATADIITALGGVVGATCEFIFSNTIAATNVARITALTDTTMIGTGTTTSYNAVSPATVASFLVVVTTATTVTVYRIV